MKRLPTPALLLGHGQHGRRVAYLGFTRVVVDVVEVLVLRSGRVLRSAMAAWKSVLDNHKGIAIYSGPRPRLVAFGCTELTEPI